MAKLNYALGHKSTDVNLIPDREVDLNRDKRCSNEYTINLLFPDEDVPKLLKRELATLTEAEYIETLKDNLFPGRSDLRVFGKIYEGHHVYIKIRVDLVGKMVYRNHILVLSFHHAVYPFQETDFPYRVKETR